MKKLLIGMSLVASVFMFSGCDSSDLPEEVQAELLSTLYPELFEAIKGDPGDSAYQVAVNEGYEGTVEEWLQSLVGADGEDGTDGVDGEDGVCPICDDNVTDPIEPPEECINPFELDDNDTDVHMAVWHQRADISNYSFYKVLVVDGYPQGVEHEVPSDVLPFMVQEDENSTFLYGIYAQEDNVTEEKAIGLQFEQTAPEVEEPVVEPVEEEVI